MLSLRKETDYAIHFLQYLARDPKKYHSLKNFSEETEISFYFMQKIARKLTRENIIKAEQGVKGGYCLKIPIEKLTLYKVVMTMEDGVGLLACLTDEKKCKRQVKKCPVRNMICKLNKELVKALEKIKIVN